jgi:spoIIIJ-associated protein
VAHAEASARTVEAAVTAAAAQLGLRSDQVDVEVLEDPVPSTFGYIGSPARVRVTPRSEAAAAPPPSDRGASAGGGEARAGYPPPSETTPITGAQPSSSTEAAAAAGIAAGAGSSDAAGAAAAGRPPRAAEPSSRAQLSESEATAAGPSPDAARPVGGSADTAEPTEPSESTRATAGAESSGSTQVGIPAEPGALADPADPAAAAESAAAAEADVPVEPSRPRSGAGPTPPADRPPAIDRSHSTALSVPGSPAAVQGPNDPTQIGPSQTNSPSGPNPPETTFGPDLGPATAERPGTAPTSGSHPAGSGSAPAQDLPGSEPQDLRGSEAQDLPGSPTALGAENGPASAMVAERPEEPLPASGGQGGGGNRDSDAERPTSTASVLATSTETEPSAGAASKRSSAAKPRRTSRDEPIEPQMVEADTERAGDFLEGLLDALDVDGDITTWVDEAGGHIDLEGADLDVLVGSNGETLDALQELTRIAVLRQSKRRVRLLLDVNGYRAQERDRLISVVKTAVERVARTREEYEFEPMTPAERKIVHDTVAAIDGVRTESLGEEPYRRVVIRPT